MTEREAIVAWLPTALKRNEGLRWSPKSIYAADRVMANSVPDESGCILWQGARGKKGDGHMRFNKRYWKVHRVIYESLRGPIPEGLVVRHACDTPNCVNIEHLLLGTIADNNADCVERGRTAKGVKIANAKLDDGKVAKMRASHKAGASVFALAEQYGISTSTAHSAIHGKTWKHVLENKDG